MHVKCSHCAHNGSVALESINASILIFEIVFELFPCQLQLCVCVGGVCYIKL